MLYFAYGSNMDWTQMSQRCPSTEYVGLALLPHHRLAFTRRSRNRGCGVADAVRSPNGILWGVVYRILEVEIEVLDRAEGYRPGRSKNSYWRRECTVLADGDEARQIEGFSYFGDPESDPPLPNQAYKDLLLFGARYWRLPEAYIVELEAIEVDG